MYTVYSIIQWTGPFRNVTTPGGGASLPTLAERIMGIPQTATKNVLHVQIEDCMAIELNYGLK